MEDNFLGNGTLVVMIVIYIYIDYFIIFDIDMEILLSASTLLIVISQY